MSNSTIELLILREIKKDAGLSLKKLAKELGMSKTTVGSIANKLKENGLIKRASPRRRAVYLTQKGYVYFNSFHSDTTTGPESDI